MRRNRAMNTPDDISFFPPFCQRAPPATPNRPQCSNAGRDCYARQSPASSADSGKKSAIRQCAIQRRCRNNDPKSQRIKRGLMTNENADGIGYAAPAQFLSDVSRNGVTLPPNTSPARINTGHNLSPSAGGNCNDVRSAFQPSRDKNFRRATDRQRGITWYWMTGSIGRSVSFSL